MARPRKNDSNDLIRLIDEYFSSEAAGDPSRLKSSLLEKYASDHGVAAKAYDFRRDPEVQAHISYLKKLVSNEGEASIIRGDSYKTLDIRSLIQKYRDTDDLISVLYEMDTYWKNVYDAAQSANNELENCRKHLSSLKQELDVLKKSNAESSAVMRSRKVENYRLTIENRYLRSMLRTYLYPALANKILQEEHVAQCGTESLTPIAETDLVDGTFPSSFSEAISHDHSAQYQEADLIRQMWDSIGDTHEK